MLSAIDYGHKKRVPAILCGLLLGVLLPFSAWAQNEQAIAWILPGQSWKSFSTRHFQFHFEAEHQALAERAALIAEREWQRQTRQLGWSPKGRIEVVLTDDFDLSNGWASPQPYNQMRLFLSPPDGYSSLESYDDWLNLLITHELTHVIHLDMAHGVPAVVRRVLGRNILTFPHLFAPGFFIEGLAVYQETDTRLAIGRGQGTVYQMMMRSEVLNGVDSLSQAALQLRDWPLGKHYLYGYYYVQFLVERFGEDKLKDYLALYSRNILPFVFLNPDAKRIFGKSHKQLWPEFVVWLEQRFAGQIARLSQQPATPLAVLTDDGLNISPSASDGQHYYYLQRDGEDRQRIVRLHPDGSKESLASVMGAGFLDVYQGQVLYTRFNRRADGRVWADIFRLQQGREQRLTQAQRYRAARWLPNAQGDLQIVAKRIADGVSQLDLLTSQGTKIKTLWRGGLDDVLGDYAVSPDGRYLVASLKRPQQGWNLELFDLAAEQWQAVTDSRAIETGAQFTRDGRSLIYSADYGETFNIYQLDLDSRRVTPLTHVMTGALLPQLVADDLYVQHYSATGFDHARVEAIASTVADASDSAFDLASQQGRYDYPNWYGSVQERSAVKDYQPWDSLRPRQWFPIFGGTEDYSLLGVISSGQDALARHGYTVQLAYDTVNSVLSGGLQYDFDNRWQFSLLRSHSYTPRKISGDKVLQVRRSDQVELARSNLLNVFENKLSLTLGLNSDQEQDVDGENEEKEFVYYQRASKEGLVGARFDYNDSESYLYAPGLSWGNRASLIWENNEVLDSDFSGNVMQFNWSMYWDLPGRQVLALHTSAAWGDEGARPFELGGEMPLLSQTLFGRENWALRGYPQTVQAGNRLNSNTLEYRSQLLTIEKNWDVLPLGLGDISGNLFVDHGSAWRDQAEADYLTGAGIELSTEVVVYYRLPIPVRLGYAYGFDDNRGEERFYLGLGYHF